MRNILILLILTIAIVKLLSIRTAGLLTSGTFYIILSYLGLPLFWLYMYNISR